MSRRMRWSERIAALEQLVAVGGGGGSTGGDGGGGLDTAAVEAIVDQKIADLPTPSGGGGSSEVGIVLPIVAETVFAFELPSGDAFDLTLDGTLDSDNPPAPPGAVSWAHDTAHDAYYMMVNSRNDGQLAHQVVPGFFNAVAVTQQQFLDIAAQYPGAAAFHYSYGLTVGGPYYHLASWNNAMGGAPSNWSDENLAAFNAALTDFGFPAWPDAGHPARADIESVLNIALMPNGASQDMDSVISGSDDESLSDAGLVIGRAVTGHTWRVLAKSTFITRPGAKRVAVGQSVATLDDKRKTHILGATWDDTETAIDSVSLDFGGAEFNGQLTIVPKAVVAA